MRLLVWWLESINFFNINFTAFVVAWAVGVVLVLAFLVTLIFSSELPISESAFGASALVLLAIAPYLSLYLAGLCMILLYMYFLALIDNEI